MKHRLMLALIALPLLSLLPGCIVVPGGDYDHRHHEWREHDHDRW